MKVWRRVLKDFIAYFRDAALACEAKSKSLQRLTGTLSDAVVPSGFLREGGIMDTNKLLIQFHRQSLDEGERAKQIFNEIVHQLTGLRGDLSLKIKEIKAVSGDFKNSLDKEVENSRRAINSLHDALGLSDSNSSGAQGKGDPYIVRLAVERQIRKQLDEENYLHRVSHIV
jgi:hypothetical protein